MKIKYNSWQNDSKEFKDIKSAVQYSLTPDAYTYNGAIESLSARIEKLQEMVATLIELRYGEQKLDHEQLQDILGHGFEVEE